ncbi:MAG TPA: glycosyltransferase family 39 protein [Flavisolibacter sp.]
MNSIDQIKDLNTLGSILFQKGKKVQVFSYKRNLLILLGLLSVYRLLMAFVMELGNDETYYWLYSQKLQWNYFDHPPLVAIWIRIFTFNLALDHIEGFIRLGSVVGGVLSSWMIFKTVSLLHSERAGWYAAVLYNASFYAGVTAGIYILPDSPQMVFWTFSMWMIAKITRNDHQWWPWILFAIGSGLCIMSKVHGAFLWIGLGAWILFFNRCWLKKPQLYLAVLISLVIISPIFIWNYQYDFATWRYHSQRVDVDRFLVNWKSFLKQLASQVGFNNPVNVILVIAALVAWKKKLVSRDRALHIFNLVGVPLAGILLIVSLFRDTALPHWSGPAYISLLPLAAIRLAGLKQKIFPSVLKLALGVFLIIYIGWALAVEYLPGTYSRDTESLGRGDITVDMYGWDDAGKQFSAIYNDDRASGEMPPGAPMVTSHWWGAHVEYYFCRPLDMVMLGLGENKTGHYLWLNKTRKDQVNPNEVYCVVPSADRYRIPYDYYKTIEMVRVIDVNRNGRPAHRFFVYRLKGLQKEIPFR